MYLLRAGAFVLLISVSAQSKALFDPYYSQALDIDYALSDEDESIRGILKRTFRELWEFVTTDDHGQDRMFINNEYFGVDPNAENNNSSF